VRPASAAGRIGRPRLAYRPGSQPLARMDKLTPDQARKIHDALGPPTGYLWRLLDRLYKVGLDVRDPELTRRVAAARDAMHSLSVELHYQSAGHEVGRPPAGVWEAARRPHARRRPATRRVPLPVTPAVRDRGPAERNAVRPIGPRPGDRVIVNAQCPSADGRSSARFWANAAAPSAGRTMPVSLLDLHAGPGVSPSALPR
jgi:hypothetical protein